MKFVRIAAHSPSPPSRRRRHSANELKWSDWNDELFSPRHRREALRHSRSRGGVVPLVPCDGEDDLRRPRGQSLLASKYIPVRVDQDANPDLSSRYGDWGWPATIVFGPDGTEIAKIRGYIEPARMQALLKAIIDDPSPGPSVGEAFEIKPAASAFLTKAQRADTVEECRRVPTKTNSAAGARSRNTSIADSMDLAMTRAEAGDATAAKRARQTLDAAIALIDPVWGGVFQYSERRLAGRSRISKRSCRFRRSICGNTARPMRCGRTRNISPLRATSNAISRASCIGPDGAFYVSQDADLDHDTDGHKYYALGDAERRKLGMPRIDKNLYARENGWAISRPGRLLQRQQRRQGAGRVPNAPRNGSSPTARCPTADSVMATRIAAVRSSATPSRWDRRFSISMPRPAIATG